MPNSDSPLVLIVDDDSGVRAALQELLESVGIAAQGYPSTRTLLEEPLPACPCCIILDVRMPGCSGLDFQQHFAGRRDAKPIVFLTAHGDIAMSVQAMKAGAVDFLTKPVRDQTLLDAVVVAIERDRAHRAHTEVSEHYLERFETLTPRERQVLGEVARGRLNKQLGYDLGISEATVKLHRSNVMRKMEVATIGELIRAWETLVPHLNRTARSREFEMA